jgi:predicted ATPase
MATADSTVTGTDAGDRLFDDMAPSPQFLRSLLLLRAEVPSFDAYPFSLPAVRELFELTFHPSVTYLVGENGSGKSTLLEAIAVASGFNPEGGSKNFAFSTRASHSELHRFLRLSRGYKRPKDGYFLRAESFYNVASEIDHLDEDPLGGPPIKSYYGGASLHVQSHGESFMALLTKRLKGPGLYIFDEPEAALSPSRQMAALVRIHQLVKRGAQFIIATHSPILMAYPEAQILLLGGDVIRPVAYDETEHFSVTRDFLNDHQRMLRALMDEGDASSEAEK